MEIELKELCGVLRGEIGEIGNQVKGLMDHGDFQKDESFKGQHGEIKANIMLSYRHLEDARMGLGKVIQQIQGGVSCFGN
jgi:hypothetical protein